MIGKQVEERIAPHLDTMLEHELFKLSMKLATAQALVLSPYGMHLLQHQLVFDAQGLGLPMVLVIGLSCNTK
jgi:hypothetical protein